MSALSIMGHGHFSLKCATEPGVTLTWFQVRLKSLQNRTDRFLNVANDLQTTLQFDLFIFLSGVWLPSQTVTRPADI